MATNDAVGLDQCRACGAPKIFKIVPLCQVCLALTFRAFAVVVLGEDEQS